MTEDQFIRKVFCKNRRIQKMIIINKSFKNKNKVKLGLVRYILCSNDNIQNMLIIKGLDKGQENILKFNYYSTDFSIGFLDSNGQTDIVNIYRRNKILDFIRRKTINFQIKLKQKRFFPNDNYIMNWDN